MTLQLETFARIGMTVIVVLLLIICAGIATIRYPRLNDFLLKLMLGLLVTILIVVGLGIWFVKIP